jgi:hypothetical protein
MRFVQPACLLPGYICFYGKDFPIFYTGVTISIVEALAAARPFAHRLIALHVEFPRAAGKLYKKPPFTFPRLCCPRLAYFFPLLGIDRRSIKSEN